MNHLWLVKQNGTPLGTVEALSRKGALHEAYDRFEIDHDKRKMVTVEKTQFFLGVDPAHGADAMAYVLCSFNPNLTIHSVGRTLEDCKAKFDTGPFKGFPE